MQKIVSWFCKIFLAPIVRLTLIKEIKGWENIPKKNFILASNHLSHLDIIMSGFVSVPRRFTYLGQIDRYKGLAALMRNIVYSIGEVIPVDRQSDVSRKEALEECVKRIKRGDTLVIYPEGTRSRTGEIQNGKLGVARIYLKTGVPILPMGIKGTFELLPPGGKLKIRRIITLNIGKPLHFEDKFQEARDLPEDSPEYREIASEIVKRVMEEITKLVKNESD